MLSQLELRDFRNFTLLEVAVPEAGLVIVGENGHGKSNLLEAVAYLSILRSSRDARDIDCVRFGTPAFYIRAQCAALSRYHSVSVGFERATKKKKAVLDGVDQNRLANALGALPSVVFSPSDVSLVAGGPAERRRYLDITLSLTEPAYLPALQHYRGALARRNAELRLAQRDNVRGSQCAARAAAWEPALAKSGAVITTFRAKFVAANESRFSSLGSAIGEDLPVSLQYALSARAPAGSSTASQSAASPSTAALDTSVVEIENTLLEAFESLRPQEMRRGTTLSGPHRDDLTMLLGGHDLRTFGSAGQQRSAAIALRLIELATLQESLGRTPLLLLDDPFAELDARRSSRMLELLSDLNVGQVLLAVPRVTDVPKEFTRLSRCTMRNGNLMCGDT